MSADNLSNQSTANAAEDATYLKVTWRLIPLLLICYIIAYLDRVNVNFAKLEMPWFSSSQYAFGAGIFFIAYFIFEVPSKDQIGIWISR
jgi:sugar phosphate permease